MLAPTIGCLMQSFAFLMRAERTYLVPFEDLRDRPLICVIGNPMTAPKEVQGFHKYCQ